MGTRADFYVGDDTATAEWIGSIAYDGYPDGDAGLVMPHTDEIRFRQCVGSLAVVRDDFTCASDGWPWPWKDSQTTDYAYVFSPSRGKVDVYLFGRPWSEDDDSYDDHVPKVAFPDMTDQQNVTFGKRSGVLIMKMK